MTTAEDRSHASDPKIAAIEEKVAGSSFYSAMRLMPKAERDAMFAIYAFCRAVDDIADDGVGTRPERMQKLGNWRADLDALYAGGESRLSTFLAPHVRAYGLRKEDLLAVIDGMQMDVEDDIRGPDLATLDHYCDRVASAVGRLSIKVFGMEEEPGFALAHELGRALQLTNILRDLDEDAAIGRLYLPLEFLADARIAANDPQAAIANPGIDPVCRAVARRAHEHYRAANAVMARHPKGQLRAPRLMGAVYSAILSRMETQGWAPPRTRAKIGKGELLMIVLRHGLGQ
ncbi:MAG TPA: presqualene diphosphate synthase HpnD [Rhizomicrobium sp.]|nr:presqualene diphosphate synthase HpnD [Rhizomicrobium sp.]